MATAITRHIYRPGHRYAKAGVMLMDLRPASTEQLSLNLASDPSEAEPQGRTRLMGALNTINQRWGRGTLHLPAQAGPDLKGSR